MKEEETSGAKGCFVPNSLWVSFMAMIIFCSQLIEAERTHPSEVEAMRAVRESLVDPMKYLVSWNKKDPCIDKWECVACYDKVGDDGYWHIKEIQLLERNLSGSLSPELGKLGHLEIMDFMWNQIEGSIPKEIGSITSLRLLLLNGNRLSGTLPDELGNLSNLDRFQIDENFISGPLPKSLANMTSLKHMHMNNNSISGQIPPELARLPMLVHLLLDNNNLSGYLPPEFSASQTLIIIQLDNNNFSGSEIPGSYNNISTLVKLSLRNCSLQGTIPDFSRIPMLTYLDLSWNKLEGFLPTNRISNNITTIDFSYNKLTGSIPTNLSGLPALQKLSLRNNTLNGSFPFLWKGISFDPNATLILDFRNNFLSGNLSFMDVPLNVTIMLEGNPVCSSAEKSSLLKFCSPLVREVRNRSSTEFSSGCPLNSCPKEDFYDYIPASPEPCYCAAPIRVGYRLKSPGFSDFAPYLKLFEKYLSFDLELSWYQVSTDSFDWEEGPRLRMYLKIFPNLTRQFNVSEVMRIRGLFAGWEIHNRDIFGPYELLNFTLLGPYSSIVLDTPSSGWSKQAIIGAILGTVTGAIILSIIVSFIIVRSKMRHRYKHQPRIQCEGVKSFTFKEIAKATNNFSDSAQIGRGGFGKVYKATLSDGTVVAVKRASEGSLQGSKEFCTEIELLSRLHHRNLVSLVGYCDEEAEQMLIYEFMSNGTLLDHLSSFSKNSLDFFLRLRIALDSAKGILYLHTEADPPILHRDIKAANILLDSRFTAKVADFGLSRLAPTSDEGVVFGHVSTVVKGTPGYLDPEYFLTQKLTDKSDVYSLGVVFLELWTGLRAISLGKNIVREVRTAYESGSAPSILDKRMSSYPPHALGILLSLALRCCNEDMEKRPTMQEVVRELETAWQMALDAKGAPSQMVDVESLTDQRRSRTDEASSEPCSSQMPNVPESDVWVEVFPR